MARSIQSISTSIYSWLVSNAATVGLTVVPANWSKTDYKKLTLDTVAIAHSVQEQLYDSFKEDMDAVAKVLAPQTAAWIQNQMLKTFQYDAVANPIVQLDTSTFVPYYSTLNTAWNIIKYCSVVPGIFGTTTVKVSGEVSSGAPSVISGTPLLASQSFMNLIGVPGITYNVVSKAADRLFLQLDVYYNGIYSGVIETNVINAINNFLLDLSTKEYGGVFLLSNLEKAILNVTGVIDVVLINVQARADSTTVGTGTNLILNKTEIQRNWTMDAGCIIPEDTSGANWKLTDFRVGASGDKNLKLISQ